MVFFILMFMFMGAKIEYLTSTFLGVIMLFAGCGICLCLNYLFYDKENDKFYCYKVSNLSLLPNGHYLYAHSEIRGCLVYFRDKDGNTFRRFNKPFISLLGKQIFLGDTPSVCYYKTHPFVKQGLLLSAFYLWDIFTPKIEIYVPHY